MMALVSSLPISAKGISNLRCAPWRLGNVVARTSLCRAFSTPFPYRRMGSYKPVVSLVKGEKLAPESTRLHTVGLRGVNLRVCSEIKPFGHKLTCGKGNGYGAQAI